ncbi:hypothetical protein CAC42_7452 [Sphaceloma murrayae]|uniref:SET domain-containing protein n=1 Tax=Sphaceloma murrayae TaxID=2082308 RepID=A0A2K1QX27_9PEZI|nr:hypothetical protein CAC42_7452 [Sphaceloma murrayae]
MPVRAVKRPRVDAAAPIDRQHVRFAEWARDEHGIYINGVTPAQLPNRGVGLVADKKLRSGDTLIRVGPESMIRPDLKHYGPDAQVSPQAKLVLELLRLHSDGDDTYKRCAATWPDRQVFQDCLFWYGCRQHQDREFWDGKLQPSLFAMYTRLRDDFDVDDLAIKASSSDYEKKPTEDDIMYYWTIANTRSFAWKSAGQKEGVMVMCPFLDFMNHCPAGEGCTVKVGDDGFTLVADRDYNINEEILGTYGAHSNDKLLVHYGFTVPNSADDSISLDSAIMPNLTISQKHDLEAVGFLGNYSLTPSTNEICFRTQVALRARRQTSNEWEFFMNCGDDIGVDVEDSICRDLHRFISVDRKDRPGPLALCQSQKRVLKELNAVRSKLP